MAGAAMQTVVSTGNAMAVSSSPGSVASSSLLAKSSRAVALRGSITSVEPNEEAEAAGHYLVIGMVGSLVGLIVIETRHRKVWNRNGRHAIRQKHLQTQVHASPKRTTSSAPDVRHGIKGWLNESQDGIKNPDGWQFVGGRWITKEESRKQEEKIEVALQEARLRKAGLAEELQRRIDAMLSAKASADAAKQVQVIDTVAEEWADQYLSRFGNELLSVLAIANKAAVRFGHHEFSTSAVVFGLLSMPASARMCCHAFRMSWAAAQSNATGSIDESGGSSTKSSSSRSSQSGIGSDDEGAIQDLCLDAARISMEERIQADEAAPKAASSRSALPFTPALREVLEAVELERQRLGHMEALPGHLVLVLSSGRRCAEGALEPLVGIGLDPKDMRPAALESMGGFLSEAESKGEALLVARRQAVLEKEAQSGLEMVATPGLSEAFATLSDGLIERGTEAKLLLLAALAGEHLFLLGSPGTAKSLLARRLSKICAGEFFERLLTRFSVPEEIFGPLSLQALEQDELRRKTQGFIPKADVAFVDEIFKANSSILNTMLMILNERCFDNGGRREKVPLWCVVAASNELPDTDELDALYDRFLLRRCVQRISVDSIPDFLRMALDMEEAPDPDDETAFQADSEPLLSRAASEELQARAKAVEFPERLLKVIAELREYLEHELSPPIALSDRRLAKAVRLVRVAAAATGAKRVVEADLWLLQHIFWGKEPEQAEAITAWLSRRLHEESASRRSWYFLLDSLRTRLRNDPQGAAAEALRRDLANFIEAAGSALEAQLRISRDAPCMAGADDPTEPLESSNKQGCSRFFWLSDEDIAAAATAGREAERFAHELGSFLVQAKVLYEVACVEEREQRDDLLSQLLGTTIGVREKVRRDEWGDEL